MIGLAWSDEGFRPEAEMAWTWGSNTLAPGETQRWWLAWGGYPGFEVISVQPNSAGAEIDCTVPGMQGNPDGSTTYFLTIHNAGSSVVQYSFTGATGNAWTWGTNTLTAGASQSWWLWWPTYPGFEIIGVQCLTPGVEIDYSSPGMQSNADGSSTYFVTVTNVGRSAAQYHFVGLPVC
jgi:hypothetical protein